MMLGDENQSLSLLNEFPAGTNILVVGSNLITLLDMKKIMNQFSYQVTMLSEADEAMAFLTNRAHEINIVIWDFHMPKINGIEALKIIGSKMDLPVVIMSDHNDTQSVMKATMHGACDYVMKPVSEQVIANIWQHIVRKRMMSKPDSAQTVQSDLTQSHVLDQPCNDPKTTDQHFNGEPIIDMEDKAAKSMWADLEFPSDLVEANSFYLDNDDLKIIYQDNGEQNISKDEENAAKKPRMVSMDSIQPVQSTPVGTVQSNPVGAVQSNPVGTVQSNPVGTDGLDQESGEQNMDKKDEKRPRKARMTWTKDLHQKFLDAIDVVGGIEKANPMLILKYLQEMNVKGLTRTNVASHLQKHRLNIEETRLSQEALEIGRAPAYGPLSLLGSSSAHTTFGPSTAYRPSSLLGAINAHTEIGPSTAFRPSSLLGPGNAHTEIGQSTGYRPSSLLGPGNAHSEISQSAGYRPSPLQGPGNAHSEIGQSAGYRPSPLLGPGNAHTEIGQSTTYRPSSLPGSGNAHTAIGQSTAYRPSSLLDLSNAYTARASYMNGREINQIHQNQYTNGYVTTNNNHFMTSPVPSLPYLDHTYHQDLPQQQQQQNQQQQNQPQQNQPQQKQQQPQQQPIQYQVPQQMNYAVNKKEPEEDYGLDDELFLPEFDQNGYLLNANNFYQ